MLYTIVSILCIVFMVCLVFAVVFSFFKKPGRSAKRAYLRSFKIGKCTIVYFVAIPLLTIGFYYDGLSFFKALWKGVSESISLIALKYTFDLGLIDANIFFKIALYLCYVLVFINAVLLVISLFHQGIDMARFRLSFRFSCKEKVVIIGNNSENLEIYNTCDVKRKYIADVMKKEQADELFLKGASFLSFSSNDHLEAWLEKYVFMQYRRFRKPGKINIIINTNDEELNMFWCGRIVSFANELAKNNYTGPDKPDHRFDAYVLGDREFENTYVSFVNESDGFLHYKNEYTLLAMDFCGKYPLTEFMTKEHIDTEKALIRPDVNINVVFVGFGRTNQQMFLTMVATNQFLSEYTSKNGKTEKKLKKVNYYFFDKNKSVDHKNLNHTYYRYRREFFDQIGDKNEYRLDMDPESCHDGICAYNKRSVDKDGKYVKNSGDYLEVPELPATEQFKECDINDSDFYKNVVSCLGANEKDLNFVIVALGSDSLNVDIVNKLIITVSDDRQRSANTYFFTRTSSDKAYSDKKIYFSETLRDRVFCFGIDRETKFNYKMITNEKYNNAAIHNYVLHKYGFVKTGVSEFRIDDGINAKWYWQNEFQRLSNTYAVLSLRLKMHLMGLNIVPKSYDKAHQLTFDEYYAIYGKDDMPHLKEMEKGVYKLEFSPDFLRGSKRGNLAETEHTRWNAFHITKGFVPASEQAILCELNEKKEHSFGKNFALRHHGNLCTFDALYTFRKVKALVSRFDKLYPNSNSYDYVKDYVTKHMNDVTPEEEAEADVIKYDYTLLDGAWSLLDSLGYALVIRDDNYKCGSLAEPEKKTEDQRRKNRKTGKKQRKKQSLSAET